MIYCVSDIHGELDKFERLLDLIQFSDADHLYVIGDVIDRGAMGVDILDRIMAAPNMTMLLGNHEQMCLNTLGPHNEYGARDLWRQNGGASTYRELLYHRTPHERNMILRFLAGLPDHLGIVVGTQKFHIVHGCPGADREARIWGRVSAESGSPYPDTVCVVGHTPTNFLTGRDDEDFRIWHGDGIIDIDCGCGHLRYVYADTQKELTGKLRQHIDLYQGVDLTEQSRMTLGEWLDRWLEDIAGTIRPNTMTRYQGTVDRHIKPYLGDKPISQVKGKDIQRLYETQAKRGNRNTGEGLSSGTVRGIHSMLHEALGAAQQASIIPRNPTEEIEAPKFSYKPKKVLTDKQLDKFMEAVRQDAVWYDFFYTELTTGLRRGEI